MFRLFKSQLEELVESSLLLLSGEQRCLALCSDFSLSLSLTSLLSVYSPQQNQRFSVLHTWNVGSHRWSGSIASRSRCSSPQFHGQEQSRSYRWKTSRKHSWILLPILEEECIRLNATLQKSSISLVQMALFLSVLLSISLLGFLTSRHDSSVLSMFSLIRFSELVHITIMQANVDL